MPAKSSGTPQRRVLRALNPAARALGLRPGQSLTAAHALTRDFTLVEYDPARIEHWQQLLAAWAYRFSSQVSLRYPRCLLLEVESSFALFGPWPRFEARLRRELAALGFRHRIVAAPNPAAAVIVRATVRIAVMKEPSRISVTREGRWSKAETRRWTKLTGGSPPECAGHLLDRVAHPADAVAIEIRLPRVGDQRALVDVVADTIAVRVDAGTRQRIGRGVGARVHARACVIHKRRVTTTRDKHQGERNQFTDPHGGAIALVGTALA